MLTRGNYIPGIGNPEPELMIVGEAGGKHENDQMLPLVGPSGIFLNKYITGIGYPNWRSDCYITNVVKYTPPDNDFGRIEEIGLNLEDCVNDLIKEFNTFKPNLILVLGANAYKALKLPGTLEQYRGTIQFAYGRKLIATYHPARFLYTEATGEASWKPYEKAVFQHDLERAFKESKFKDLNLPRRDHRIVKTSNQFIQFLQQNEGKTRVAEDIESINFIPYCIGFAFKPSQAISVPLFDHQLGESRSARDKALLWLLIDKLHNNPKIEKVGQNWKYDGPKLEKLGMSLKNFKSDIMLKGHVVCPEFPKSLEFMSSIYTREPYYKSDYQAFKTGKTSINDFMIYNCKDAAVTIEIDQVLEKDLAELGLTDFYYEFVMELHDLYCELEKNGLAWDEEVRKEIMQQWCQKRAKIEIELFQLLGMDVNTSSPKQVQLALYERLKLPYRKGTGEATLVALLANHAKRPDQKRAIELILLNRRTRRLLETTIAAPTDYDGRMRTSVFIPATETRRTADHVLDVPIRPYVMGIPFKIVSKHGEAGDIRRAIVPDKGCVFLNFDQSQAEARVCSLLADDEVTLKNFDEIDIHAWTAALAFGGTWEKWSKKKLGFECPERFIGKTLRHAGHLDMQKRTCMETINTDAKRFNIDVVVSEWKAGELLKVFHQYTPKIKGVFHEGIQAALLRDNYYLTGTSPCEGKNWFPKRQFYGDWDRNLWKEAYAFIPQQTVTDKTKWILIQVRKEFKNGPVRIAGESHDAGLFNVEEREVHNLAAFLKEVGEQPIDFSRCSIPRRNLIIPIDIEIGEVNYKKLEKYKFAA